MANTHLTRTVSSGADLTKWTWSCWVKRTDLVGGGNNYQRLISNEVSGNSKAWYIRFQSSTQFHGWSENGAFEFTTNGKYRDINGWYNLVVKYDSTQSTQSNRLKVFVNGEEPSMSAITYPSLNQICNFMNSGNYVDIGYYRQGSSEYFHGLMSHMHFTAGYAYDASSFGSTDATTGEWKINTSPSVTYGSQGFFILKDGNSVTDQSGEGNNFTVGGGTLTKTEDCPSNVFATYNPLCVQIGTANEPKFGNGNTSILGSSSGAIQFHAPSTLGASSGKWYAEFKGGSASNQNGMVGVTYNPGEDARNDVYPGQQSHSYAYFVNGNKYTGDSGTSYGNAWTTDIIGVALDLDNHKLYFSKNGVFQNSGDPTSGSTGTGSAFSLTTGQTYFFATGDGNATYINPFDANFGNGYFGTTAVSSAGTNASGIGIFEHDVPTGYTALSTKGLNL